jgi:hypothetical protein
MICYCQDMVQHQLQLPAAVGRITGSPELSYAVAKGAEAAIKTEWKNES